MTSFPQTHTFISEIALKEISCALALMKQEVKYDALFSISRYL